VATATAVPTTTASLSFTLDAVRVSKPGNPGNLSGLAAVKRGSHVWLMMYYTVASMPKSMTRTTTYQVLYRGKLLYQVVYKSQMKKTEIGRFSRYADYTIPKTLPFGHYTFHAALTIGKLKHTRSWKFDVGNQDRQANTGS
jgi:hypothetical protein